jgi:hypothetical protein
MKENFVTNWMAPILMGVLLFFVMQLLGIVIVATIVILGILILACDFLDNYHGGTSWLDDKELGFTEEAKRTHTRCWQPFVVALIFLPFSMAASVGVFIYAICLWVFSHRTKIYVDKKP